MKLKRNVKLLAWFNFCTDFVLFSPIVIIYFSKITGSIALAMSVLAIAYTSAALFELPTGIISDYLGRKKTLVTGAICAVLCMILYAVSQSYILYQNIVRYAAGGL